MKSVSLIVNYAQIIKNVINVSKDFTYKIHNVSPSALKDISKIQMPKLVLSVQNIVTNVKPVLPVNHANQVIF